MKKLCISAVLLSFMHFVGAADLTPTELTPTAADAVLTVAGPVHILTAAPVTNIPKMPPAPPAWLKEKQEQSDKVRQVVTLLEEGKYDSTRLEHSRKLSKAIDYLLCKNYDTELKKVLGLCKAKNVEINDTRISGLLVSNAFYARTVLEEGYRKKIETHNVNLRNQCIARIAQAQAGFLTYKNQIFTDMQAYDAVCASELNAYKPGLMLQTDILSFARDTNPAFKPEYDIDSFIYPETMIAQHLVGDVMAKEKEELQTLYEQFNQICTQASLLGKYSE
jgi:hypothetical protein